ncbi:MAG: hypothetical protein Q9210_000049 [Variospora velana]
MLSTSRWEDETLCLASVMDIETKSLAALPTEDRMETFLEEVRTLPAQMLFGNGYRSKRLGLIWAPRTFLIDHMSHPSNVFVEHLSSEYGSIPAFGQQKGFLVAIRGYDLIKTAAKIKQNTPLKVLGPKTLRWYLVYCASQENP